MLFYHYYDSLLGKFCSLVRLFRADHFKQCTAAGTDIHCEVFEWTMCVSYLTLTRSDKFRWTFQPPITRMLKVEKFRRFVSVSFPLRKGGSLLWKLIFIFFWRLFSISVAGDIVNLMKGLRQLNKNWSLSNI